MMLAQFRLVVAWAFQTFPEGGRRRETGVLLRGLVNFVLACLILRQAMHKLCISIPETMEPHTAVQGRKVRSPLLSCVGEAITGWDEQPTGQLH